MIKEACVETFEEAVLAEKKGADRIELCADLANDGVTPSFHLMEKTCASLGIPVMVMIRPRAGNFVYSADEISIMKQHIDQAKRAGVAGIVTGLLTKDNHIDEHNTRLLAEYAHPLPVTFHKAIDLLEDPAEGVAILRKIKGIKRILTSGGKATAREGIDTIKRMIKVAGDDIIILVAGKVTSQNAEDIQQMSGAEEFHGRKIVGELL